MKKTLLVLLLSYASFAQGKNISAIFSYCTFDVPGSSAYLETYLNIIGNSVNFIPSENGLKGQVEILWVIKSGDSLVYFDKYNLNSPEISSTDQTPDFIDQQRVNLPNGEYNIELSIRDKNSTGQATTLNQKLRVSYPSDTISISDIELIEKYEKIQSAGKFSKNGYDIVPYVNTFYPSEISSLKFYAEIYRSDIAPADEYLVRYHISNKERGQVVDNYVASIKHSPRSINVIIGDFDITDLTSGNYNLNIEVRNKKNQLIAFKQTFFQRSNERNKPLVSEDYEKTDITNTFISPVINRDTMVDYLACLYPISTVSEVQTADNLINYSDITAMKRYFYSFWSRRNPDNPEFAWNEYRKEVDAANAAFTVLNKKGYDTERGRVYLQYGAPNAITDSKDEPTSYPYEIWHYYKLKSQSNRKFVFYTTDRSSNDYKLLHSDAVGELSDPAWELFLHKRTQQYGIDLDKEKSFDTYGGRTKENFSNPK